MDDDAAKKPVGIPLSWLMGWPVGVCALAYVGDIVFGSQPVVSSLSPEHGFQWYAVITAAFCVLEALVAIPMYLRKKRYTHAIGLFAYLAAFAALVAFFASFQR